MPAPQLSMDVILIAAVTADGFIARSPNETIRWSRDLTLFKKQTLGHPVIMGSNTWAALGRDLLGREVIIVHHKDDPGVVLQGIQSERCFIAGGGRTNARFAPYLTHLFLTVHPLVFGAGVRLFADLPTEMKLVTENVQPVDGSGKLIQFQYRITDRRPAR